MDPPRKRRRANTNGDATPSESASVTTTRPLRPIPQHDLSECIEALDAVNDGVFTRKLLVAVASEQPDIARLIRFEYDFHIKLEQRKVINFDYHSLLVWYKINMQYSHRCGFEQYVVSFKVVKKVTNIIQSVAEQASKRYASFGTRSSGLENLRKIGMTICMGSNETLGHAVQKHFRLDSSLVDAIQAIVSSMSVDECEKMCDLHYEGSTFLHKMERLRALADDNPCFEGLDSVIALLNGEAESEDDNGEGDDDEVEEEEDEQDEGIRVGNLRFANEEEEMEYLDCFNENGAPRSDARSQRILARYR